MNFEDIQKSWQNQKAAGQISINAELLLKEVRRNQQQFRATILFRDVREVGVAFVLTVLFVYLAICQQDWTNYLIAVACFGVGTFMVVDRRLRRGKLPESHDSLRGCIEMSLAEVRHQIWLLKNVLWWYLLPIGASVVFSVLWSGRHAATGLIGPLISVGVIVLVNGYIYWLNQHAVRKSLEPRRRELESLLAGLDKNS